MGSITRYSPSIDRRHVSITRWLAGLVAVSIAILLALSMPAARADTITARTALLEPGDDSWLLSADFDISLSAPVEEALSKGITLFFVVELEVTRSRWYWFDQRTGRAAQSYRLGYNTLTQQFRLSAGTLFQNFATLDEALGVLGRVRRRATLPLSALAPGATYDAAVRLRLDLSKLPRPFQASPFASREWNLASDWYRFTVSP